MKSIYKNTIAVAINTAVLAAMLYAGTVAQAHEDDKITQGILDSYQAQQAEMQAEEMQCLALNIYFETHAKSLVDAMSVSDVVLNRVVSTRYANTVCGVVHQGYKKGSKSCQFSWYCDGKHDEPYDNDSWEQSRKYAHDIYMNGNFRGMTQGATHYHAHWMKAYWASSLNRVARIGSHIFYIEK